jgi:hypothetical protein
MALLVGAVLAGSLGVLPREVARAADQPAQQKISAAVSKPLSAANDAIGAKKYEEALAKLKEADAIAKKTPYDQHVINRLFASAYYGSGDTAQSAKYFELVASDGITQEPELHNMLKAVSQVNFNLKNYDKAIEYANRAQSGGHEDADMQDLLGKAYYLKEDWKGTQKFEEEWVEGQVKKGQVPQTVAMELWLSACQKLNDDACITRSLERLVTYDPQPKYWESLMSELGRMPGQNDRNELQLYRLMLEVNAMTTPGEYTEMAQLALGQGSPGEAQHVLEKGFESNAFNATQKANNQKLLETAKRRASTDLASLPQLEKEAQASPNGNTSVAVGYAYLGYQQYDKAAENLSRGIAKGGLKDEAGSRLLLGIAQLKGGHKDEALQSFRGVKGDPLLERIANLWAVHAGKATST